MKEKRERKINRRKQRHTEKRRSTPRLKEDCTGEFSKQNRKQGRHREKYLSILKKWTKSGES